MKNLASFIVLLLFFWIARTIIGIDDWNDESCGLKNGVNARPHSVSILEFGAVGNGITDNTVSFQNAIFYLTSFADKGGAQLYVPKGRWLTGSIKIISHLTLFLEKDAVILGTCESTQWPAVEPLPSYGEGLEIPGGRYRSLIYGYNLTDVAITGDNGTIDGQGFVWWDRFNQHTLNYSRPHLMEFISSDNIVISNLTFLNSPSWNIHPIYCSNVLIHNITITADYGSPLTNGIVPDSCSNVCIEDSSINVGHDAISLKSGWDEYGISYGKPVSDVYIFRVNLQTLFGSALSFGSEMSGGIYNVHVKNLNILNSSNGIMFKTTQGRGGFVKDIVISDVEMENVNTALHFTGQCGRHPDDNYDQNALPILDRITVKNVVGKNISVAGKFFGIDHDPFTAICLSSVYLSVNSDPSTSWTCSDVFGFSESVFPEPCPDLQIPYSNSSSVCYSLASSVGLAIA